MVRIAKLLLDALLRMFYCLTTAPTWLQAFCYDLSNLFVDSVVWFHLLTSDYQQVGIDFIFDSLRAFALKRTVVSTWRVMDNTPVHDIQGVSE